MDRPQPTMTVPEVVALVHDDPERREILAIVASVTPDAWIGAGFVRNRIWDHLTGCSTPLTDIDVLVFSPDDPDFEARTGDTLRNIAPTLDWDVRDQSRMHVHNGHRPYRSVADAIARFPETATALAIRGHELLAPYGLGDVSRLLLRRTPWGGPFEKRVATKGWTTRWPVTVDPTLPTSCAGWLDYGGWQPIPGSTGRWTWSAGANPDIDRFARFVPRDTEGGVFVARLVDGEFIASVVEDHTILTLVEAARG